MGRLLLLSIVAFSCTPTAMVPTPAPIPPPSVPLQNLEVVSTFPGLSTGPYGNQVAVVGGRVVAQHYATLTPTSPIEIASFDPITGARAVEFEPIDAINSDIGGVARQIAFLRSVGDRMIGMTGGDLSVFDPINGRRWQTSLYEAAALARLQSENSGLDRIFPVAAAVSPGAIYVVVAEEHQHGHEVPGFTEIVALDDARRSIRWRKQIATRLSGREVKLFVASDAVVVQWDGQLIGYDMRDGTQLWTTSDGAADLATDGETLVAIQPDRWRAINPHSGTLGSAHADHLLGGATLHDGVLYGFIREHTGDVLVAERARDGARIWQSELLPSLRKEESSVIAALDAVYGCAGGSLRAFDRATGALRFSYGLGGCELLGVAGGAVIVRSANGKITSFARATSPPNLEQVHVSGVVTMECAPAANAPVRIGDALVTTNTRGHYDATVIVHGMLRIETTPETTLLLDGQRVTPYVAYDRKDLDRATSEPIANFNIDLDARCRTQFSYQRCAPVQTTCTSRARFGPS